MKTPFHTRLAAARTQRDMTQGELAAKASLDPSAISHFEKGQRAPSLANLVRIIDALEVPADYLLGLSDAISGSAGGALCKRIDGLSDRDRAVIADLVKAMERRKGAAK
jgi:transcriptional regulator with XRE-family HTH domain